MDTQIFKNMIAVIRKEQKRRLLQLKDLPQDIIYDQREYTDIPFINELCLMLIVALRHQIERELIALAARVDESNTVISSKQYQENKEKLNEMIKKEKGNGWSKIYKKLNIKDLKKSKFTKVLCYLSNSFKHEPSMVPNEYLLTSLQLNKNINYCTLPEGGIFQKELAKFIGLGEDVDYCDITEKFVDLASKFILEVKERNHTKLCKVSVSLNPKDFSR